MVADLSESDRKDIFAHSAFVMKARQQMLKAGDESASKKCPFCEGRWHFVLAGPRKHIHGYCDGSCNRRIME